MVRTTAKGGLASRLITSLTLNSIKFACIPNREYLKLPPSSHRKTLKKSAHNCKNYNQPVSVSSRVWLNWAIASHGHAQLTKYARLKQIYRLVWRRYSFFWKRPHTRQNLCISIAQKRHCWEDRKYWLLLEPELQATWSYKTPSSMTYAGSY